MLTRIAVSMPTVAAKCSSFTPCDPMACPSEFATLFYFLNYVLLLNKKINYQHIRWSELGFESEPGRSTLYLSISVLRNNL